MTTQTALFDLSEPTDRRCPVCAARLHAGQPAVYAGLCQHAYARRDLFEPPQREEGPDP